MARRRIKKGKPGDKARREAMHGPGTSGSSAKDRSGIPWPLLALSLAGMALTGYLSFSSWFGATLLYCEQGSGCDLVQQSAWGTFLAVPTAFWGFWGYFTLAGIFFGVRHPEKRWQWAWTLSLIGLAVSIYLTVISLAVLQAACLYCLASLALMGAIFITVWRQRPASLPQNIWSAWSATRFILALLIIGGLHLHYSGVFKSSGDAEDPFLKAVATHLTETKAILYGAFW